jgi:hypothetical protein
MFTRVTLLAPLALALIACGPAPPKGPLPGAPSAQAQIPPWGLDLSARDPKVRPGDDFYRYADGHWLDTHKIPADRTRWGSFDELDERASAQVLEVVHALPLDAPEGSNAQKVGDYYRAFVDIAAIDAKGIVPARAGIDAISRARPPRVSIRDHATVSPSGRFGVARSALSISARSPARQRRPHDPSVYNNGASGPRIPHDQREEARP